MNKFRLYCLLNKNTKLSYKRSPMFEQNKWAKALIYFGSALFGLYLILYGIIIAMTADGEAGRMFSLMPFILIIDYLLRWATADFKAGEKSVKVFLQYPFTTMAIVDLISILPSLTLVNESLKTLRALRMLRALRSIRVLKGMRYWKNFVILGNVLEKSKDSLLTVGTLAAAYILVSALIIFNVEPETFNTFFDALYWATISLTTVGYGDIYAVSTIGRLITMISSLLGIAIVALPASIFTAEYIAEMRKHVKNKDDKQ